MDEAEEVAERFKGLLEVEVLHHPEYDGASNEVLARVLGLDLHLIVKTLVVKAGGEFVACVIPGDGKLDFRALSRALGISKKKLRMASPEEIEALGYAPGCIPPTAAAEKGLRGVVDEALLELDRVLGSAGRPYYGVWFDPKGLLELGYAKCSISTR